MFPLLHMRYLDRTRLAAAAVLAVATLAGCSPHAQRAHGADDPEAEFVEVVTGLYALFSGPAGERDWDAIRALFLPGATMHGLSAATTDTGARVGAQTFDEWMEGATRYFAEAPLYERPIAVRTMSAHSIGHVITVYESRVHPDSAPYQTGIMSAVLYQTPDGWRIATTVHAELSGTDQR